MGIIQLFAGKKTQKSLKRATELVARGRPADAERVLLKVAQDYAEPIDQSRRDEYLEYYTLLARAQMGQKKPEALQTVLKCHQIRPGEEILRAGISLIEAEGLLSPEATEIVGLLAQETETERGFLLTYAKRLVSQKERKLTEAEHHIVLAATKAFTLWKGGSTLLADEFLEADRRDAEAISLYRIAYPSRRGDLKLTSILLENLVVNNERTEFAAQVYEECLDRGIEHEQALRLLAEHYIEKKDITPKTIGHVQNALRLGLLGHEYLEQFSAYLLRTRKEFLDKKELLLAIYRAGYFNKNLLAFLALAFAEEGNFSDEALAAYEEALKNNLLTKRITLLLTEHFLGEDRRDGFACRTYEQYLSSWPERKQPRIYYLLSESYVEKKRTDEQAQKIYEDALSYDPEFTQVLPLLAASYLTYDTKQPKAYAVYERAYPLVEDDSLRRQIARLLAEHRIDSGNFDRKTLEFIEVALPMASGPAREALLDARTKCYLMLDRRDPGAIEVYLELYRKSVEEREENIRLIGILSDVAMSPPAGFTFDPELKLELCYRRFELEKFSCPESIAFFLLNQVLTVKQDYKYRLHLVVRCLELQPETLAEELSKADELALLQDVGRFYLERHNYEQAARVFSLANKHEPSEENTYHLAKILLTEGKTQEAVKMFSEIRSPELAPRVRYWRVAALQQEMKPKKAAPLLTELEAESDSIPEYLLKLRQGLNAELAADYAAAIELYKQVLDQKESRAFHRWLSIQIGLAYWRADELEPARAQLAEVYRQNPSGRAEQRNYSYILATDAHLAAARDEWEKALSDSLEAVDVNREDRLLRSTLVDILLHHAQRFFFDKNYEMAVRALESAHRILPRNVEIKIYLAYSYHLLHKYAPALIYYRDITWSDDAPMLERSQAYCYLADKQLEKAWRVFLDLKRRGNLLPEDIPLMINAFLADKEAAGGEAFANLAFPEEAKVPLPFAAFYIHDGQYDRALTLLSKLAGTKKQELQRLWFMGKASSLKGDRELAVAYWRQLLEACLKRPTHTETKVSQLLDIGIAFLQAGYAQEAMETWETLKKLAPDFRYLNKLYAATLDLNAYTLSRKGNHALAIGEWEKATKYDPENLNIIQNLAISYMMADNFDNSAVYWSKLTATWQEMVDRNPQLYAHLTVAIGEVEKLLTDVFVAQRQETEDVYTAKTEEMVDYFQRANEFYWILSLDKRATKGQVEKSYFRLVKIFNPERHAADFMLLEDSYANLTDEKKRDRIDIFAFNPVNADQVRKTVLPEKRTVSVFEEVGLNVRIPSPDYSQLKPMKTTPEESIAKLTRNITFYFRLGDISVI